ncbi:fanconi anemia group J protein, partial [Tanacetum coccineum]
NMMPTLSDANNTTQKKKRGPVIYYATRTHSQISQVIGEFRKTNYHVPMAVLVRYLVSKDFLSSFRDLENATAQTLIKLLIKVSDRKNIRECPMIRAPPVLSEGAAMKSVTFEDLVKLGEIYKGGVVFILFTWNLEGGLG